MKIIFINLLNNFSGSPHVLSIIIKGLLSRGHQLKVITNRSVGFLSKIPGIQYKHIDYKWDKNNSFATLFSFIISQLELFFTLIFYPKKDVIYYINTITPIGAIIACKLTRKDYYIHVHENMAQNKLLFVAYKLIYKWCNKKSIFVSKYVQTQALNIKNSIVAYNGLSDDFSKKVLNHITPYAQRRTIIMICSLRTYKGIYEFINLSYLFPQYKFELIVGDNKEDVDHFKTSNSLPANLEIFPSQINIHPFYQKARIVLNLSKPDVCIETFGLTLLEGLSYGIPVIGPKAGGPMEIIDDNINGFLVNSNDQDALKEKVQLLMTDNELYSKMAEAALSKSKTFSSKNMIDTIENYLKSN